MSRALCAGAICATIMAASGTAHRSSWVIVAAVWLFLAMLSDLNEGTRR